MKRGFLLTAKAKRELASPANASKTVTKQMTRASPLADTSCSQYVVPAFARFIEFTDYYYVVSADEMPDDIFSMGMSDGNELMKKTNEMMSAWGLTADDLKGMSLASVPDENDPVPFAGGWSQCLLSGYLKRRLGSISGFPRPLKETEDKAYNISSAPGKGLGMFASRKIKMGDLTADERPLMVVPLVPVGLSVAPVREGMTKEEKNQAIQDHSEGITRRVFEFMHEESRKKFMELHNSHTDDGSGPTMGVIRTNGYGLGDELKDETGTVELLSKSSPDEKLKKMIGKYTSVYNMLSRVNHSCSPNTHRKFYMSSFSMQLRAARDIEEGEEILTTYTEVLLPAAERAKELASYGIQCTCRACLDCTKSDPIRAAVSNRPAVIVPMIQQRGMRPDAWIDPAVEILAKIEEEELRGSSAYHKTLHQLFNAYVHQNDEKKALMYGEKLWFAALAAGEKQLETFRNAELMKKSPQWLVAGMTRGIRFVQSFI
ncbi:uncharacterized protein EV420DRAFT_1639111 [Desarmillaria tabescens]|uniref:SET domain-containing protein n=1 Tax=Armillaria tabescens TaxID=1929756 RepID=A0AA39NCD6_ARMTA|nr:uncharacterized protein EV420DRAFT_1639111 [Desarmillaria tabescens]KAK0463025.1 hypothetical protein EV420DRAFT_1639111 [Desarmillaria tabescens]